MSLTLLPPPPLSHEAFQPLRMNGVWMDGLGFLADLTSRCRYVDDTVGKAARLEHLKHTGLLRCNLTTIKSYFFMLSAQMLAESEGAFVIFFEFFGNDLC